MQAIIRQEVAVDKENFLVNSLLLQEPAGQGISQLGAKFKRIRSRQRHWYGSGDIVFNLFR